MDEGELFKGLSSQMKTGPWLSAEDLLTTPTGVVVTIEAILHHRQATFEDGKKEEKYSLKFAGKRRQLVLNATNRKALLEIFGTPRVSEWIGKQIELYLVDGVRKPGGKKGETCLGIRIRHPGDHKDETGQ